MNWNAVAAIGTCLVAAASFLTVLFAILSNRKSNELMSGQISSMKEQLFYLSDQNNIVTDSIRETKEQTDIAREMLNLQYMEMNRNRSNVSEIKIQDMREFLTLIKAQNQIISIMSNKISERK